ncbi:MAG: hypothetical protein GY767_14060 [Shimia sp.]|nr:hypothetical protein [Shimia sp.]
MPQNILLSIMYDDEGEPAVTMGPLDPYVVQSQVAALSDQAAAADKVLVIMCGFDDYPEPDEPPAEDKPKK